MIEYFDLPFGLIIQVHDESWPTGPGGKLVKGFERDEDPDPALDALESLILAHAVAGIDINSPAYKEGIETAVEAVLNAN